jgi:hypothetical protein
MFKIEVLLHLNNKLMCLFKPKNTIIFLGNTTNQPETHYLHLKCHHPYSPALAKFYDKRHFKFNDTDFPFKE